MFFGKRKPGLDKGESNSGCSNPPLENEQMKTVTYGPESKGEGMVNILVKRIKGIRKIGEQCIEMVIKDFKWS